MALEGSIRDFSLADIFQLIGIQRKTGILTLIRKDEEVKVSFMGGMVVNADSHGGRVEDRLGSVLTKTGKVGQEDLQRALKIQKQTLKKLGVVLVENGIARPEDLREALSIQITQVVYRLFRWKDGDYHFEQDTQVDYDKENFTPMSAESILMEGMRMIDEWPVIERKIGSFAMVFERVELDPGQEPIIEDAGEEESAPAESEDDFDVIFGGRDDKPAPVSDPGDRIRLTREEGLVYERIDGQASVQEIIERVMLPEFEVCRAIYDLSNRNLVVPVVREKKAKKGDKTRTVTHSDTGRRIAAVLPLAAAIWVGVAWASGLPSRNPLNILVRKPAASRNFAALSRQYAITRANRLAEAVDIFVLSHLEYPKTSTDLVQAGLIDSSEQYDPWGREISFEQLPDRIAIRVHSGAADDSEVITIEHKLTQ